LQQPTRPHKCAKGMKQSSRFTKGESMMNEHECSKPTERVSMSAQDAPKSKIVGLHSNRSNELLKETQRIDTGISCVTDESKGGKDAETHIRRDDAQRIPNHSSAAFAVFRHSRLRVPLMIAMVSHHNSSALVKMMRRQISRHWNYGSTEERNG
jgi:hypothetical protein